MDYHESYITRIWQLNDEGEVEYRVASQDDTAPSEILISDVFPKPETEEEKRERMWKAVREASQI